MAPKRALNSYGGGSRQEDGYVKSLVKGITSPDNRSVITALGIFAAGVAFLNSSWSEYIVYA